MAGVTVDIADHVATIAFGDPGRVTFFSGTLIDGIGGALDGVAARDDVRCAVITGRGESFIAGADVHELRAGPVADQLAFNARLIELNDRVARFPVPVVCALNGHAFGGGLELALACSFRVADETARVGFPEVKVGIVPGSGGLLRIWPLAPRGHALRLLLTGASVPAADAARAGLVEEVAPAGAALATAHAHATQIAANAPLAVAALLRLAGELPQAGAAPIRAALAELLASADAAEGFAAFGERRRPRFSGR